MLRAASLGVLVALALLLGACGGGAADGGVEPAAGVPADAAAYVEVAVRPSGRLREDTLAAASKVLREDDVEGRVRELVDEALAEEDASYEEDVASWLGERASLWVSARVAEDADGRPGVALLVAATDTGLAMERLDAARERSGEPVEERSHAGVDYQLDEEGVAYGAVGDFIVVGDEPEFRQTVDTLEGDSSLETSERYRSAMGALGGDRLGHFFLDTQRLLEIGARSDPEGGRQLDELRRMLGLEAFPPVAGSLAADGERLALDVAAPLPDSESLGRLGGLIGTGGATPLLEELPGDSWLALGAPDYGETLRLTLDTFAGAAGGALLEQQLQQQLGLGLDEDVLSWIGDVAIFVRGETMEALDGGLVIEVTDGARATRAFGKLVGAVQTAGGMKADPIRVPGADGAFAFSDAMTPKPIVVARGSGKVVAAYGEEAAAEAFSPAQVLRDSELFAQGQAALGEGLAPSMLLSMPSVGRLVDVIGQAGPEWDEARPYLEAYTAIAAGTSMEGDVARSRIVAGLAE